MLKLKSVLLLLPAALWPVLVSAQTGTATDPYALFYIIIGLLVAVFIFQTIIIRKLTRVIMEQNYRALHGTDMPEEETAKVAADNAFTRLWKSLTRSVPKGREKDVLLSHDYDGIRELDNRMPPWLQLIFYGTILFAFAYVLVYHVYDLGKLPMEEYSASLQQAELQKAERLKLAGASVDETNVVQVTDAALMASGKTIYVARCAACHGNLGEGGVGPNMTDDYWIHGGSIQEIFKTVKYGVPAKGMVPWQGILKPEEMQNVAGYIMSLKGTNPPNAKAPQGILYSPQADTAAQAAATDSVSANP